MARPLLSTLRMRIFVPLLSAIGLLACGSPDLTDATVHRYRITSIDLPDIPDEVSEFGLDVDGDTYADNQLGQAYQAMQSVGSHYHVEEPSQLRLTSDITWTLTLYETADLVGLHVGRDRDADPTFAATGTDELLTGGTAELPFGALTDALSTSGPAWLTFDQATARIERTSTGLTVDLAGSLAHADIEPVLAINLASFFTAALSTNDSEYAAYVDTNTDNLVSIDELRTNQLFTAILTPDLHTTHLSFGLRLTAIPH
jgi:hypothetical protein